MTSDHVMSAITLLTLAYELADTPKTAEEISTEAVEMVSRVQGNKSNMISQSDSKLILSAFSRRILEICEIQI